MVKSLKYDYENFQLRETWLTPLLKPLLRYQAIKLTPDGMFFLGPLSKSYLIHAPFIKKNSGYKYRLYFLKNSFIIYFHLTFPVVREDVSVITAI